MSAAESLDAVPRLVDLLLAEQRTLRAVDEFSAWHEVGDRHRARFETLIPTERPGEGRQYAFAVDLDACTGCKACVTACHSLNGLELGESWRRVGELEGYGDAGGVAHRQTVTAACHHCASPACLAGCPVQAYEKDPISGIVRHLDDQCIGCRYCQLTCPYDVPQYSERLGIVRKCDMCHGRLAVGEAPACVQGCPSQAISIELVRVEPSQGAAAAEAMLLPVIPGGMPPSTLTGPTTVYRTARTLPTDLRPIDDAPPQPAEAHGPLAVMLVLTQAAVGTLAFDLLAALALPTSAGAGARLVALFAAAALGFAGLGASVLHLGRPQWAFRAVLGLRTSWMSREIVAFGGFGASLVAALGTSAAAVVSSGTALELGAPLVGSGEASGIATALARLDPAMRACALATGIAGLFCSIRIYAVTGRPSWRADRTALRFGSTLVLLGAAVAASAWSAGALVEAGAAGGELGLALALPVTVMLTMLAKLQAEHGLLVHGEPGHDAAALDRTRALLRGPLASEVRLRRVLGLAFGMALPGVGIALVLLGATSSGRGRAGLFAVSLLCAIGCLAGELVERRLFFRSEAMRGMPGPARAAARVAEHASARNGVRAGRFA